MIDTGNAHATACPGGARPRFFRHAMAAAVAFLAFMGAPVLAQDAKGAEAGSDRIQNSVVKIFSTVRLPDPFRPWTKQAPKDISGSGVIIEGKRILTNAHVVLYANQIQVQANRSGDKVPATVVAVAPGIDLALLKLDDESLFSTHPPLQRANTLPDLKDTVMTFGFPAGGANLSITKGIVSRIEFAFFNFPYSGLRIQIDAALNAGNSGGPAVVGDKMIGVAFSRLSGGAENIGYIVPCEEIELFLKDAAAGRHSSKPMIADELQTLENPQLRSYLKLDKTVTGLVVRHPASDADSYPLRTWDVVTKIGDTDIDNQGMVNIGNNLRVRFSYLAQKLASNGTVPLTIVRNGKILRIQLPVVSDIPRVIRELHGEYPPYFIYGPLVFSVASTQFVNGINSAKNNALAFYALLGSPLVRRMGDKPEFPDEELVIVSSPFFPHALSKGYGNPTGLVVKTVNGISIRNLNHLVQVLRDSRNEFDVITYWGKGGDNMVFPRRKMIDSINEILNDNGIRSQGSQEAMSIWSSGKDSLAVTTN